MERVEILRLGHLGDGIATGPLHVPLTLPGEIVTGQRDGRRLENMRIERASEERVRPPCRHFTACGGCALQHGSDDFVARWKQDVVRQGLAAQGIEAAFRPILTSDPATRRRAGLSARRTKKGALAGFHGRRSGTIVEVPDCRILETALMPALELARDLALAGASRKAELQVLATVSESGLDVQVSGGKPSDHPLQQQLSEIAREYDLARLRWGDEVPLTRRAPVQRFGRAQVVPPPGAFLQATKQGEAALLDAAREATDGATRVVDLFAGCGTFSLPLAEAAEVTALEGDAAMIAALDRGWREAAGLKRVQAAARDLFRNPLLADELARFDAAVIDPPRAGAAAQVAQLAASGIPRIAYLSCNPVSFARDAKLLIAAGYELAWIQVIDQFRWSPHVELAAAFRLNSA